MSRPAVNVRRRSSDYQSADAAFAAAAALAAGANDSRSRRSSARPSAAGGPAGPGLPGGSQYGSGSMGAGVGLSGLHGPAHLVAGGGLPYSSSARHVHEPRSRRSSMMSTRGTDMQEPVSDRLRTCKYFCSFCAGTRASTAPL